MSDATYRRKPQVNHQYGPVPDGYEWVIYDRISDDRDGTGLGVQRQERINFAVAERLGGTILTTLTDNDLTANDRSRRHKTRPAYTELCRLLREKPGMRGVIVWHSDRLHRSPRELEDFLDLVEETSPRVHTVQAGPIDLTTPGGRAMARQLCVMARYESEIKSARVRAKAAELADAGAIASGGPRPFGYHRVHAPDSRKILRDELHPTEAPIVETLVRRALAGDTLRTLVRWLNAEGITTTMGGPWSQQGLRWMLLSARIAGLREHHGQVVAKAVWPAIISVEDHKALRHLLASSQRQPGSRVRKHYLSGFLYCSACVDKGVKMRVSTQHHKLRYKCPPDTGCNGRVIGLEDLEQFIDDLMIAKLSDPQTLRDLAAREADTTTASTGLIDQIEADERRLTLLQASLDDGDEEDLPEVLASVRHIRRRMKTAREKLGAMTGTTHPTGESLPDLARRWPSLDIDQKQGLLRLFVDKILILPAVRRVPYFDPSRVDVVPIGG